MKISKNPVPGICTALLSCLKTHNLFCSGGTIRGGGSLMMLGTEAGDAGVESAGGDCMRMCW